VLGPVGDDMFQGIDCCPIHRTPECQKVGVFLNCGSPFDPF
jgi:hypothetical protein